MSAELGYGIAALLVISGLLFKFTDWLRGQIREETAQTNKPEATKAPPRPAASVSTTIR